VSDPTGFHGMSLGLTLLLNHNPTVNIDGYR